MNNMEMFPMYHYLNQVIPQTGTALNNHQCVFIKQTCLSKIATIPKVVFDLIKTNIG